MDAFESRLASVAMRTIDELTESRVKAVVNGQARSFEHYRHDVGYLQGLAAGREAIEDARKTLLAGERIA